MTDSEPTAECEACEDKLALCEIVEMEGWPEAFKMSLKSHHAHLAAKDAEIAALRAGYVQRGELLARAMDRLGCKCGWLYVGKEGFCRPDFTEHSSCDFALEVRRALEGVKP